LLAFSRKQVLSPRIIDLNEIMMNLDSLLRRLIGEDIEVLTVPATGLGSVKADPGQIEQVIMNLVLNARDAMPSGGKLTIETANAELDEAYVLDHHPVEPGSYVMLAVSDTGEGMSPEVQARIFEPFFTTKEVGKGTGLGLATVYGIIKQTAATSGFTASQCAERLSKFISRASSSERKPSAPTNAPPGCSAEVKRSFSWKTTRNCGS